MIRLTRAQRLPSAYLQQGCRVRESVQSTSLLPSTPAPSPPWPSQVLCDSSQDGSEQDAEGCPGHGLDLAGPYPLVLCGEGMLLQKELKSTFDNSIPSAKVFKALSFLRLFLGLLMCRMRN